MSCTMNNTLMVPFQLVHLCNSAGWSPCVWDGDRCERPHCQHQHLNLHTTNACQLLAGGSVNARIVQRTELKTNPCRSAWIQVVHEACVLLSYQVIGLVYSKNTKQQHSDSPINKLLNITPNSDPRSKACGDFIVIGSVKCTWTNHNWTQSRMLGVIHN